MYQLYILTFVEKEKKLKVNRSKLSQIQTHTWIWNWNLFFFLDAKIQLLLGLNPSNSIRILHPSPKSPHAPKIPVHKLYAQVNFLSWWWEGKASNGSKGKVYLLHPYTDFPSRNPLYLPVNYTNYLRTCENHQYCSIQSNLISYFPPLFWPACYDHSYQHQFFFYLIS